jgi:prevent-host-death family protein
MTVTKPTSINATTLKTHSGALLKQVFRQKKHYLIERSGYPIAALIPIEEYRQYYRGPRTEDEPPPTVPTPTSTPTHADHPA